MHHRDSGARSETKIESQPDINRDQNDRVKERQQRGRLQLGADLGADDIHLSELVTFVGPHLFDELLFERTSPFPTAVRVVMRYSWFSSPMATTEASLSPGQAIELSHVFGRSRLLVNLPGYGSTGEVDSVVQALGKQAPMMTRSRSQPRR